LDEEIYRRIYANGESLVRFVLDRSQFSTILGEEIPLSLNVAISKNYRLCASLNGKPEIDYYVITQNVFVPNQT